MAAIEGRGGRLDQAREGPSVQKGPGEREKLGHGEKEKEGGRRIWAGLKRG